MNSRALFLPSIRRAVFLVSLKVLCKVHRQYTILNSKDTSAASSKLLRTPAAHLYMKDLLITFYDVAA